MRIVADLHTHTNVSHHALSTFEENVAAAKKAGLIALATTNHGPDMEDSAHKWHFGVFRYTPKHIDGIAIIGGAEANIFPNGDIDEGLYMHIKSLDYIIASIHDPIFGEPESMEQIEEAYLKVLQNEYVTTLGHMGTPRYKYNYESIISKCNEYGKIVEINSSSFKSRVGSRVNCAEIAKLCQKYKVPVALTSDAHYSGNIGNVEAAIELIKEINFDPNLIINTSKENLDRYFKEYRGIDIFNR